MSIKYGFIVLFDFQILHEKVHDVIVEKLKKAYAQVKMGDPCEREL